MNLKMAALLPLLLFLGGCPQKISGVEITDTAVFEDAIVGEKPRGGAEIFLRMSDENPEEFVILSYQKFKNGDWFEFVDDINAVSLVPSEHPTFFTIVAHACTKVGLRRGEVLVTNVDTEETQIVGVESNCLPLPVETLSTDHIQLPQQAAFHDALTGTSPPLLQVPLSITDDVSQSDEPWPFTVSTDSDWIVAPDTEYGMLSPHHTLRIPLNAKPCTTPGERTGSITVHHHEASKAVKVGMNCAKPTDVVFGQVDAYQSVKIGATEWKPASEVPVISGKPGAIRAEVQAHFVPPGGHVEVEALVLRRDGRPHPTLSPLKYLREPYDDPYSTLKYKAIHEFKAPAGVFGEDVRLVLTLDPNGRVDGDNPDNNRALPLESAPRLPEGYPLAPFRFNLTAVTMTIVKDGVEHVLKGELGCPNGCMTPALDWLPINRERVQIRTHELVIEEPIEFDETGTHPTVRQATYEAAKKQGIVDENWDVNRQTVVAVYQDTEEVSWIRNRALGVAGDRLLAVIQPGYLDKRNTASIIAHEIIHNYDSGHSIWADPGTMVDRCGWFGDWNYPYRFNEGQISGDPDGPGPLRVHPAYNHAGNATERLTSAPHASIRGFIKQDTHERIPSVMGCQYYSRQHHISDYFYLENVFGAGHLSGYAFSPRGNSHNLYNWAHRNYVGEGDSKIRQNCHRMDVSCPWRYTRASFSLASDQADVVAIRSKSAPAESDVAELQEAEPALTQGFVFEIWLDRHGYPMPETAWASTASSRASGGEGEYTLKAYDAYGVVIHTQGVEVTPAYHMQDVSGRLEVFVPNRDAERVEIRDGEGNLVWEGEVSY